MFIQGRWELGSPQPSSVLETSKNSTTLMHISGWTCLCSLSSESELISPEREGEQRLLLEKEQSAVVSLSIVCGVRPPGSTPSFSTGQMFKDPSPTDARLWTQTSRSSQLTRGKGGRSWTPASALSQQPRRKNKNKRNCCALTSTVRRPLVDLVSTERRPRME